MQSPVGVLIWIGVTTVATVPLIAALMSPLLEWRQPTYIIAGASGVIALALLLYQPMLAYRWLPGLTQTRSRKIHRRIGICIVLFVVLHVAGLWLTSPPDVVDALLFRSPTSFSPWGVVSMWALFVSMVFVGLRRRLTLRASTWQLVHRLFGAIIVVGAVVHTLLVDGTMEIFTKLLLCTAVILATLAALLRRFRNN